MKMSRILILGGVVTVGMLVSAGIGACRPDAGQRSLGGRGEPREVRVERAVERMPAGDEWRRSPKVQVSPARAQRTAGQ